MHVNRFADQIPMDPIQPIGLHLQTGSVRLKGYPTPLRPPTLKKKGSDLLQHCPLQGTRLPKPNLDFTFNHAMIVMYPSRAGRQQMHGFHFAGNCVAHTLHFISANSDIISISALDI
jgi:hypothetical protein